MARSSWAPRLLLYALALGLSPGLPSLAFAQPATQPATLGTPAPATQPATQSAYAPPYAPASDEPFRLQQLLPPAVSQNTDINLWGWFTFMRDTDADYGTYWNGDLALGITQRFGERLAATVNFHYLNDNGSSRGFLEEAFFTGVLAEKSQTLLTVGKFNASFGAEPRDEWDRLAGTTSLLFGAQPQDLVGAMLTQPIGATGITIKPIIATQFQGHANSNAPPCGALLVEYVPPGCDNTLKFTVTNWIGPGFAPFDDDDEYGDSGYGGSDSWGDSWGDPYSNPSADYALDNWNGPNIQGTRQGFLYFADANVQWNPRPDLTLALEGLFAATGSSANQPGWSGVLLLVNYDFTDRWRVFGRWSFLNDNQGLITGVEQPHHELSIGTAYQVISGVELRGEYRHDFAPSGDFDSVSVHLIFTF